MSAILSVSERIDRAKRVQKAVQECTHADPAVRISAYAAAQRHRVSQSAISQNRAYRVWKNQQNHEGSKQHENP